MTNLAWSLPGQVPADKIRGLIRMFGGKPSVVSPRQPRDLARGGMWDRDIVPFINDWLKDIGAPPVTGERLDLQNHETPRARLRRVY